MLLIQIVLTLWIISRVSIYERLLNCFSCLVCFKYSFLRLDLQVFVGSIEASRVLTLQIIEIFIHTCCELGFFVQALDIGHWIAHLTQLPFSSYELLLLVLESGPRANIDWTQILINDAYARTVLELIVQTDWLFILRKQSFQFRLIHWFFQSAGCWHFRPLLFSCLWVYLEKS